MGGGRKGGGKEGTVECGKVASKAALLEKENMGAFQYFSGRGGRTVIKYALSRANSAGTSAPQSLRTWARRSALNRRPGRHRPTRRASGRLWEVH